MSPAAAADALVDCAATLSQPGGAWLGSLVDALTRGERTDELAAAFAEAGRRVGRAPLSGFLPGEGASLVDLAHWSADDAARGALLLGFAAGRPLDVPTLVDDLYASGDNREKAAIVRTLVLLPDAARYLSIAADAGRS